MNIVDYINENYFGVQLNSLEDISTSKELSALIWAIRGNVDLVEGGEVAEACYKTAILMINGIQKPYWNNVPKWKFWINPKNDEWNTYFNAKSDFTLANGKEDAIRQLIQQWNKHKVVNVEYFLRSFEVMSREYIRDFDLATIQECVQSFSPLIELANQNINRRAA